MTLHEIVAENRRVNLMELGADKILAGDIQKRLVDLGCLDAPVDMKFGAISQMVLRQFAQKTKVKLDDVIEPTLAQELLNHTPDTLFPLTLGNDFASRIVRYMQKKKYWLARMPGFLNIVYVEGVNEDGSLNDDAPNQFNDRRLVIAVEDGKPTIIFNVEGTTEPGAHFTNNPLNTMGAARISFGQFKAWSVGVHNAKKANRHEALVQVEEIPVHRDRNRDFKRIGDPIDIGLFGINQHSGFNQPKNNIGAASAGCLVGRLSEQHKDFMRLVKSDPRFKTSNGYRFITTIIAGDDLKKEIG
ncbi:MAG: peptidoglycan-binding protein [Acidobacteria bacterium]|nr:peptidoglycan-binding protein [Acidobacteriota bacterium]